MIQNQRIIAKKYARAFFNVFAGSLTDDEFLIICKAAEFFDNNKHLLFFLGWHSIVTSEKIKALRGTLEYFGLVGKPYDSLIALLARDKRTFLIKDVLDQICQLYQQHKNIGAFAITSSHELSAAELVCLEEYLAKHTGQAIMYSYSVDKNLIAGIRMQSDTALFEYSIRKQLEQIKLPNVG